MVPSYERESAMQSENSWQKFFEHSLTRLDQSQLRRRKCVTSYQSPTLIERNGQQLVNFGGNDYLGLRNNPNVIVARSMSR